MSLVTAPEVRIVAQLACEAVQHVQSLGHQSASTASGFTKVKRAVATHKNRVRFKPAQP